MSWLQKIMYGRYGMDQLGLALGGGYVLLYILSILFRSRVLWWAALILLAVELFRMLSRQVGKRREENERFLRAVGPLIRKITLFRCRMKDKDHAYFRCPGCGQQLRAPKGKGKISVTCRSCGAVFEKKT